MAATEGKRHNNKGKGDKDERIHTILDVGDDF